MTASAKKISMHITWILSLILALGAGAGSQVFSQEKETTELLKTADEMVRSVTRLRELELKTPIKNGLKDRAEISTYINERIREEYKLEEIQNEGKMLKKLGLIPATMDYWQFIINLLTEQVGGYYDTDKKIFFIASWLSVEEQKPVMAHELNHALQDQHFDISRILKEDRKRNDNDRTLAHVAVIEGDSMAVMINYLLDPVKRNFSQLPDLAVVMRELMSQVQAQSEIFKSAPFYIQESLLFPYGNGTSFLQKVWLQNPSWQAINKIYSDLPSSTEQILHPEKYLTREDPKPVAAEDPITRLGADWKMVYKNILGEFTLGLVLRAHLTEGRSRRAVTGWGGDEVMLLENGAGKDAVIIESIWDTPEDSEKFYQAIGEWLTAAYPKASRVGESPNGYSLVQDGELHSIWREGSRIRFAVGFPEDDGRKLYVK